MTNPLAGDSDTAGDLDAAGECEFDHVLIKLLHAEEDGERIDREEWLRRYPQVAEELRAYLEDRDELNHVVRPLRHALATPPAIRIGERVQYFGDYELLEEIGRGGMGVIYRARQVSLGRIVAIKMVSGRLADAARFRAEAQAAASLDDPRIVPIYEIGEHDGCSYYSMKYVEGGSLRDRLASGPIEPRRAAELAAMIAAAVQVAHVHGILHRDLKPGNVLLDAEGGALVSDFGLAKNVTADSELTRSGDVLGTPSYMSPEQAAGGAARVTTATDVYGLGALLYAMLTSKAPVSGESPLETLDRVRRGALDKPQSFASLPRDLVTICLKCLAREPSDRYASAQHVADDLGRFLRNEAILARPAGVVERAWRWSRRNPLVASLIAAVLVSLMASAIGGTLLALRERSAREDADVAWQKESAARATADAALAEAVVARGKAEETLAEIFATYGLTAESPERDAEKVLWFSAAARQAAPDSAIRRENQLRVEAYARVAPLPVRATELRGFIRRLTFHPAGRHLLIESATGRQFLWNIDAKAPAPLHDVLPSVTHAEFSPDSKHLALGGAQGHVGLFLMADGRAVGRWRHIGAVSALAFNHEGSRLATASSTVRIYDCRKRDFANSPLEHTEPVTELAWSRSGDQLATGCADGKLRVFTMRGENPSAPIVAEAPFARAQNVQQRANFPPAFVLDDTAVLFTSRAGTVACASISDGKTLWRKRVVTNLFSLSVAPDGKFLFVGGERTGATLDISRGGARLASHSHRHAIYGADHRPDAKLLATASWDRTVLVWSDRDQGPVARLPHQAGVTCVKFSPDGEFLATAQGDGVVKLWRLARREPHVRRIAVDSPATLARFSPDGRYVMATGTSFHGCRLNKLAAYETATGQPFGQTVASGGILIDAVFAPDPSRVFAAVSFRKSRAGVTAARERHDQGRIQAWNLHNGKLVTESPALASEPRSMALSPDGSMVAVFCTDGDVQVFDAAKLTPVSRATTGKQAPSPIQYVNNGVVRFTPDGRRVLLFGADRYVHAWEAATGKEAFPRLAHTLFVHDIDVSHDGATLVAASLGNDVRRWNLKTGRAAGKPLELPDRVFRARFVEGGAYLLTACRDNLVRLQSVDGGQLASPPTEHEEEVFDARLTPDGKWIVSVSLDRTLRVSCRRTGQLMMPPIDLGGGGWCVEVTRDGRYVVAAGGGRHLTVVDLQELRGEGLLEDSVGARMGELLSGHSIKRDRIVSLTSDEWISRLGELRRSQSGMFEPWTSSPPSLSPPRPMVNDQALRELNKSAASALRSAQRWLEDARKKLYQVLNKHAR